VYIHLYSPYNVEEDTKNKVIQAKKKKQLNLTKQHKLCRSSRPKYFLDIYSDTNQVNIKHVEVESLASGPRLQNAELLASYPPWRGKNGNGTG